MSENKKYKVDSLSTSILLKTRVARNGDTFSFDEMMKPSILAGLLDVEKIVEVSESKKPPKKTAPNPSPKPDSNSSSENSSKKKPSNEKTPSDKDSENKAYKKKSE